MTKLDLRALIRDVPDFPKPGVLFKDITPLLADAAGFAEATDQLCEIVKQRGADAVVAIESRGFIFGAPVAHRLGLPLQLVRKPGKLPYKTIGLSYELEYGTDRVEIHVDAIAAGRSYVVVDDLIATGGTAAATAQLIENHGGTVASLAFVIELEFLRGRDRLKPHPVDALISY